MPFVQVNDVKLHYEMEGSGPPLLMIAGTGLPGATWRTGPSAQYAAEGFTVITFDHRGTGGSDKPDVDYSTRMFAADAVGLLQALDIPQAHVLGHSMGGRVVQWLALDHFPARSSKRWMEAYTCCFGRDLRRHAVLSWSFCDATKVKRSIEVVKTVGGLNETKTALRCRRLYNFLEVRKCQIQGSGNDS
jgi:predicted alpha/beta hydrolase